MPIVLDCSIIKEEIKDDGAIRNTSRRCKLAVDAPYLLKKVIGLDHVFFIQNNYLDLRARSLNIEAVNETYSSRIEIFERCRYYAHPENPDWTCFDQTATLDIKNFFGFEHSIEKMGMKRSHNIICTCMILISIVEYSSRYEAVHTNNVKGS